MQNKNQKGFIPMMLALLSLIALVIYFVFKRVTQTGGQ